jgi:hypothetical protein
MSELIRKTSDRFPTMTTTPLDARTLYDRDYYLWLTTTAEQIKLGKLTEVDWENLVEEIEDMVKSQKNALKSLLIVLLEHLLKLAYWKSERERNANHWRREIRAFRIQIEDLLSTSPSLKPYVREIFEDSYRKARGLAADDMGVKPKNLPEIPAFTLEKSLDEDWFPIPLDSDD